MARQPTEQEIEDAAVSRGLLIGKAGRITGFACFNNRSKAITLRIWADRQNIGLQQLMTFSLTAGGTFRWVAGSDNQIILAEGDRFAWLVETVGENNPQWEPTDIEMRIEHLNHDE